MKKKSFKNDGWIRRGGDCPNSAKTKNSQVLVKQQKLNHAIKRYELLRLSKTEYPVQICTEESTNAVSSLNDA